MNRNKGIPGAAIYSLSALLVMAATPGAVLPCRLASRTSAGTQSFPVLRDPEQDRGRDRGQDAEQGAGVARDNPEASGHTRGVAKDLKKEEAAASQQTSSTKDDFAPAAKRLATVPLQLEEAAGKDCSLGANPLPASGRGSLAISPSLPLGPAFAPAIRWPDEYWCSAEIIRHGGAAARRAGLGPIREGRAFPPCGRQSRKTFGDAAGRVTRFFHTFRAF
ncbi:MAG TPA: hypothetical protein VJX67_02980, partial [Blastocatellia bacterium]|nr:hypothetical protein [Blastocatellia bacterium]